MIIKVLNKKYSPQSLLDIFVASALITVVVIRIILTLSGFPQLGGNGLHIAHILWGGLLMALSCLVFALSEKPNKLIGTLLGGAGFGLFIDEVGKFITSDVNYFYKPAIAIIYIVFVVIWLAGRFVLTRRSGEPLLAIVRLPRGRLERNLTYISFGFVTVRSIIDAAILTRAVFIQPRFGIYGTGPLGHFLYFADFIIEVAIVIGIILFLRYKKLSGLRIVRESLFVSLLLLTPFIFYEQPLFGLLSVLVSLAFVVLISE